MDRQPTYRELTLASTLVSIVVGCAMCAAFTYTALKLSFTLAGSTIAAILGFGLLKGAGAVLKRRDFGSILEVNMAQTGASAINVGSSGIAFTLPALFLLGGDIEFSYMAAILTGVAGTLLGLVVIVPLRKQMIEFDRLRFPSGLAVASILKAPGESTTKAMIMGVGFLVSAGIYALTQTSPDFFLHLPEEFDAGAMFGLAPQYQLVFGLSLVNVAAGLLAGRGGLPFLVGGILAWVVVSPMAFSNGWTSSLPADELVGTTYGQILRPLGIGILVGGAVMGVILSAPAMKAAIASLLTAGKSIRGGSDEPTGKMLGAGMLGGIALLFIAGWQGADLSITNAAMTAVVGTVWLALAGLVVAQATGMTDISPISGMALIGVTLMLLLLGSGASAMVPAIFIGCAVSVGVGQCADMMQDLKTGHLVGAKPVRQATMQLMLTWIGPFVAFGTMYLLWKSGPGGTGGFGEGTNLPAPQGEALKTVVLGLSGGETGAPWERYGLGAAIGLALTLLPVGGAGILVGLAMYLPISITLSYGVGCLVSMALQRAYGGRWIHDRLIPFAAGLILGEALLSLGLTLIKVAFG